MSNFKVISLILLSLLVAQPASTAPSNDRQLEGKTVKVGPTGGTLHFPNTTATLQSVLAGWQNEKWVDQVNGSDTTCTSGLETCGNGSVAKPYKTIQKALDAIGSASSRAVLTADQTSRYLIHVGPGVYTETLTLPTRQYLVFQLNAAKIVGNLTQTMDGTILTGGVIVTKTIFYSQDLRSVYDGASIPYSGIEGNFTFTTTGSFSSYTPQIHFISTGITGNVTFDTASQAYSGQLYLDGAFLLTDAICTGGKSLACVLYAHNSDTSSSRNIGGVSGVFTLSALRNVRFSRAVVAAGVSGGRWINVGFPSASHNLTGYAGTVEMDSVTYQSYRDRVTTKGSETVSLLDDAQGVKYTPTTSADWPVVPTNAMSALDKIAPGATVALTNKTINADSNTITNIENADIKSGAAIARDKLANGTAAHVNINDGSGVMSSEAQLAKSRGGTGADNSSVTFPSSGSIPTLAGTESFSNKTFSDAVTIAEVATPSTPASGYGKVYFKSDGKLYKLDDAGLEGQVGSGGGGGGLFAVSQNLLDNPSWESATTNWTASGGTYTQTTTAANIIPPGVGAGSWDSGSAAQTLTADSEAITAADGLSGRNGAVSCSFKCASGTCTHLIEAYDGSNTLVSQTITSSTAGFVRTTANFVMPASGTVAARIKSVASDEPTLYIDDCYIGLAEGFNLSQVSQGKLAAVAKFAQTASCGWGRTNTALGDFSTVAACPAITVEQSSITVDATDTDLPQIKFTNAPAGKYKVTATGTAAVAGAGQSNRVAISDGTNIRGEMGFMLSASNSDNANFTVVAGYEYSSPQSTLTFKLQGAASSNAITIQNQVNNAHSTLQFVVEYWPTVTETAVRNPVLFYPTYSAKSSSAGVVTEENTDFLNGNCSASGNDFTCSFNSGVFTTTPNCTATAICDADSDSCIAVVKSSSASSSGVTIQTAKADVSATAYAFNLSCQSTTPASAPAPLLVGGVSSNSTGMERIERATLNNGGSSTCTVTRQSGSWISGAGTRNSTGNCTWPITAGLFSAAPTCTCSTATIAANICAISSVSTSAVTVLTLANTSGGFGDDTAHVICMGPR